MKKGDREGARKKVEEKALAKLEGSGHVVPELLEAIQEGEGRIDVNVILVQLSQKAEDPDAFIEKAERVLTVTERFEQQRVENFRRMAEAVIEAKRADPDEVDKRRNNRARRALKFTVAGAMVVAVIGAVINAAVGGGIVLTGLFVIVGTLALAMAGPLATGESLSPADVVRIVTALSDALPPRRKRKEEDEKSPSKSGHRKGARR